MAASPLALVAPVIAVLDLHPAPVARQVRLVHAFRDDTLEDGTPADPPTIRSAPGVMWKAGDTIPVGARTLRVVEVWDDDADQPPRLVVEDVGD